MRNTALWSQWTKPWHHQKVWPKDPGCFPRALWQCWPTGQMQGEKMRTHKCQWQLSWVSAKPLLSESPGVKVFGQVLRKTSPGEWASPTVLVTSLSLLPDREKCLQISWVSETNAGYGLLAQPRVLFLSDFLSLYYPHLKCRECQRGRFPFCF